MKKIFIALALLLASTIDSFAQIETFDLTTYIPPAKQVGWVKEVKDNYTSYTITNNKKKTWCQIAIYKSTNSNGSIEKDFESEWQQLVVTPFKITYAPQVNEVKEANGWKVIADSGNFIFNNLTSSAILTTMTGYNRCVSILAITNSEDYKGPIYRFLKSVELIKPQTVSAGQEDLSSQQPLTTNNNSAINGSWGKSNSVSQLNNRFGSYSYNKQQYIFNSNGTYRFSGKNYSEKYDETLLIKESGTYVINGNNVTIKPQSSVIEAWSKSNGADNYNKLKTTQNRAL